MLLAEKYYTEDNILSTLEKAPVPSFAGRFPLPTLENRAIYSYSRQINILACRRPVGVLTGPCQDGQGARIVASNIPLDLYFIRLKALSDQTGQGRAAAT